MRLVLFIALTVMIKPFAHAEMAYYTIDCLDKDTKTIYCIRESVYGIPGRINYGPSKLTLLQESKQPEIYNQTKGIKRTSRNDDGKREQMDTTYYHNEESDKILNLHDLSSKKDDATFWNSIFGGSYWSSFYISQAHTQEQRKKAFSMSYGGSFDMASFLKSYKDAKKLICKNAEVISVCNYETILNKFK